MKRTRQFLTFLALSLLLGASGVALRLPSVAQPPPAFSPSKTSDPTNQIAALRAEIDQLKGKVPDQSHAMSDVGYHFANLWFAGEKKNWPLAKFYLDETRSHLKWAVRIIPVRKTKAGEVDLRGILEAVDNTLLNQIQKAIEEQDVKMFADAYKRSIEGCYSCHKASEKPYLRPRIPEQPEARIINLKPTA
ncbi:MAG: hypothetical protein DME24_13250 [Verrucomicrobia bacterium]|nr:MAG: hypothetical protein DME24_13250 [Verrucomicrobiota bacterium]